MFHAVIMAAIIALKCSEGKKANHHDSFSLKIISISIYWAGLLGPVGHVVQVVYVVCRGRVPGAGMSPACCDNLPDPLAETSRCQQVT